MDYNGVEMELNDGQAYNRMLALSNVLWEHYSLLAHRYFTEQNPAINSNSRRDQFQRHGYYFSETASELGPYHVHCLVPTVFGDAFYLAI